MSFLRMFPLSEFLLFQAALFPSTSFFLKMPSLKLGEDLHLWPNKRSIICYREFFLQMCLPCTVFSHFYFPRYVIEDGSPYMRSGKQNTSSTSGRGNKGESRDVVDDLGDDVWNFMSFCKKDFVKDSIPDQQLSLQDLTIRYKGEL